MATTKPRLMLSLEPSLMETLRRLAALQGRPVSSVATDLLCQAEPLLVSIANTIEAAQRLEAHAVPEFVASLERAQDRAQPVLQELLDLFSKTAEPAFQPPHSNHGGPIYPSTSKTQ